MRRQRLWQNIVFLPPDFFSQTCLNCQINLTFFVQTVLTQVLFFFPPHAVTLWWLKGEFSLTLQQHRNCLPNCGINRRRVAQAGEEPFDVVLSAAALMSHTANTALFQHICICVVLTTWCCLTDMSLEPSWRKGKHLGGVGDTTRSSCTMEEERNRTKTAGGVWGTFHFARSSSFLPTYWST